MAIKYKKKGLLFSVNAVSFRKSWLLLTFMLASIWGYCQPIISSISPLSGNVGTTLKITGSNFSSTAANNLVNFNGVAGTVTSASSTSISVTVPLGANFGPISVSLSNKTAFSVANFNPTFSCGSTLDTSSFDKAVSYSTGGNSPEGAAIGDLDGDGYNDIVETNNSSNILSIFLNKQKSGNFTSSSFASPITFRTVGNPFMATLGDIDGDGLLDLVVGGFSTDSMYIYKNTSTPGSISFASPVKIQTTGNVCRMVIADMDNDGLPDIVVTNRSKFISIYKSSVTSSSFTASDFTKTDITIGSSTQMNDVVVADFDGDGKMDFATSDLNSANLYVLLNNGSLSFTSKNTTLSTNNVWGLSSADIDGDGKPDITGAYRFGGKMFTFINTTSGGTFSLASEQDVTTPSGSTILCVTVADMNGDGKPDFVGADLASKNGVVIIPNNSSSGSLSWGTPFGLSNKSQALVPIVSDLDGDGKPDIMIQDNSSKVILFHNKSGVSSKITPVGTKTMCKTDSFTMTGPSTSGITYQWNFDGSPISGATNSTYAAKKAGLYTLTVTSTTSGCSATSTPDTVVINTFSPGITNLGTTTRCQGDSLQLVASNGGSGTFTYQWRLNSANISGATGKNYTATATGNYKVIITNQNACVDSSSATATTFNALPTASITPSGATTFCSGGSVTLNAPSGLSSYQWFNNNNAISGATSSSLSVSSSGSYTVKVTNSNGCSATSSATTVTVNASPTASVTAGSATTFCSGGSVTLVAPTGTGLSYQWANSTGNISGATSSTYSATTSESYKVTVTNSSTCSATSSATTVTVNPLPTVSISAGSTTTFCSGGSVTLSAPTGLSPYQWINNGSNISGATSSTFSASASGSYQVMATSSSGCSATSSATAVTVNANPTSAITAGSTTTFCSGGSVTLVAPTGPGLTYQWSNSAGTISGATSSSYVASSSSNYSVTVTNSSSCSATSSATTVTVNSLPTASISAGSATTFCSGGSVTLSAPTGLSSYQWINNGSNISGATSSTFSASASGSYQVMVTNSSGCSATSSATSVTVNTNPTASITAGSSTTFCSGGSVTLVAPTGTGLTYQWANSTGSISGATSSSYSATTSDNYKVTVTNSSSCSITSSATIVTVNALPSTTISAGSATTFCSGGNVTLSAPTGFSYQWWNNGATISGATSSSYSASATGSYQVVVTNSSTGCSATSSATSVTVNANPTASITAGGPTTFCSGSSVSLVAPTGTGLAYQWSNSSGTISGATSSSYSATATSTYSVKVTVSATGCNATSATTSVTVNTTPTPTVFALTPFTTICNGGTVTLAASGGSTYQWYNNTSSISGATGSTYNATTAGNYYVQATTSGCTGTSSSITVTVNPLPVTTVKTIGSTTRCKGDSVVMVANNNTSYSYQWKLNSANISGANTYNYTAKSSGNYKVVVTTSSGCVDSSVATTITINPLPSAAITYTGATTFCQGGKLILNSPGASTSSYQWYSGGSALSLATNTTYRANTSGSYQLLATDINTGCTAFSNPLNITVNPLPFTTVTASGPTTRCAGDSVILSTNNVSGNTYQWTVDGAKISGANSNVFAARASGTYKVTVTNSTNCTDSSAGTPVTFQALPSAPITSSTATICQGQVVTMGTTAVTGYSYQWMVNNQTIKGATGFNYKASSSGTYTVQVINSLGCSSISSGVAVTVNALPAPVVSVNGNNSICSGDSILLTTGAGAGFKYQWIRNGVPMNGITNSSLWVKTAASYSVQVTNASGCTDTSALRVKISVSALPTATIANIGKTTVCAGAKVRLKNTNSIKGQTYQWWMDGSIINGASADSFIATSSGSYSLMVINASGCSVVSNSIDVKILDYPVAKFAKPASICLNEMASFYNKSYISSGNLSYAWSFGDGQSSTDQDPTHMYAKAGTYHVKLTVASDGGCVSTYTDSAMIMTLPSAAFSHQHIGFRRVTFMANDSTASSYLWKFDDGSLSSGRSAYHVYNADTTYAVTLQTTNANGCMVTETDTIRVNTSGINVVNANNSSLKIFPNPYVGKTTISYTLDRSYPVSITVYDIMGREIMKQDNTTMMAGTHTFQFGGDKPGTYIVKAVIGNREYVQQIIQAHE